MRIILIRILTGAKHFGHREDTEKNTEDIEMGNVDLSKEISRLDIVGDDILGRGTSFLGAILRGKGILGK